MSAAPLARIYFDTNILFRWPHVANDIFSMLGVANWLSAELYIPKAVEDELEGQFVRSVTNAYSQLAVIDKQLSKLGKDVIDLSLNAPMYTDIELREAFRARSSQLMAHHKISNVPLPPVTIELLLDMAINRVAPFEECVISKDKKVVVGLQDTVIILSIIEHLKSAPEGGRYAFVSNDNIFHGEGAKCLFDYYGVKIELFRTLKEISEDLWGKLRESLGDAWDKESQQVRVRLIDDKESLAKQILPMLTIADLGRGSGKIPREIKGLVVKDINYVRSELPSLEHLSPLDAVFLRPDGPVNISAAFTVEVEAVVTSYNFLGLFSNQFNTAQEADSLQSLEEASLLERLNVSLVGEGRAGEIEDLRVTGVQVEK